MAIRFFADIVVNDSDKTIVLDNTQGPWNLVNLYVALITTATVGARQLEVDIRDAAGVVIHRIVPGLTQAESLTYNYAMGAGVIDITTVVDTTHVTTPLPAHLIVPNDGSIRIFDNNAVDAAADDLSIFATFLTM